MTDVAAVLLYVGDVQDPGMAGMGILREKIPLYLTEAPRERNQLLLVEKLTGERDDRVRVERGLDAGELLRGQRLREVDIADFRAYDVLRRYDVHHECSRKSPSSPLPRRP
jgi:hypothetical protein